MAVCRVHIWTDDRPCSPEADSERLCRLGPKCYEQRITQGIQTMMRRQSVFDKRRSLSTHDGGVGRPRVCCSGNGTAWYRPLMAALKIDSTGESCAVTLPGYVSGSQGEPVAERVTQDGNGCSCS